MKTNKKKSDQSQSQYRKLGVDPSKENVKKAFKRIIDNEYPRAFVNIITDPYNEELVLTQHQDGDGSKSIQRWLHFYQTGDQNILGKMVDDALAMNTSDVAASGFVFEPWIITDVLNISNIPSRHKNILLDQISNRMAYLKGLYEDFAFKIKFLGGETADLPDQVKSSVFDIAITAWANKKDVITGDVKPNDIIFGFFSDGRAIWEDEENSGLMANGLTLARRSIMSKSYNKIHASLRRRGRFYKGKYDINTEEGLKMSQTLLSPTRQWPILIREIMKELKKSDNLGLLHGISINTGGGARKIMNLGQNIKYVKRMPAPPEIFQTIQAESKEKWHYMYETFNCGIGIDVIGENNPIFVDAVEKASLRTQIKALQIGVCLPSKSAGNEVLLQTNYGDFTY